MKKVMTSLLLSFNVLVAMKDDLSVFAEDDKFLHDECAVFSLKEKSDGSCSVGLPWEHAIVTGKALTAGQLVAAGLMRVGPFHCPWCTISCDSEKKLLEHVDVTHQITTRSCDTCIYAVLSHMWTMYCDSKNHPYACNCCCATFVQKASCVKHVNRHPAGVLWSCIYKKQDEFQGFRERESEEDVAPDDLGDGAPCAFWRLTCSEPPLDVESLWQ